MLTDLPCPKANFSKAELSGAKLCGATLTETSFVEAVVRNADFTKADLSGAVLQGADLTAADLSGADLTGTKFAGALNLRAATFDNLRGAILDGADLSGVDLSGADLTGTKFAGALNLRAATFDNLRGAILDGADLSGADLSGADLTGTKFAGALFKDPVQATNANVSAFPMGNRYSVKTGSIVFAAGFIVCVFGDHPSFADRTYYRSHAGSWDAGTKQGYFWKDQIRLLSRTCLERATREAYKICRDYWGDKKYYPVYRRALASLPHAAIEFNVYRTS